MKRLISILLLCAVMAFTASAYADGNGSYIRAYMDIPQAGEPLFSTIIDSLRIETDFEDMNGEIYFGYSLIGGTDITNQWMIKNAFTVDEDYLIEENAYYAVIIVGYEGGYESLALEGGSDALARSGGRIVKTINDRPSDPRFDAFIEDEFGFVSENDQILAYIWNTYPVPATGDSANPGLWFLLMSLGFAGMVMSAKKQRAR